MFFLTRTYYSRHETNWDDSGGKGGIKKVYRSREKSEKKSKNKTREKGLKRKMSLFFFFWMGGNKRIRESNLFGVMREKKLNAK